MSRLQWLLRQFTKQLWFRASLFALLGVLTATGASLVESLIPFALPTGIGTEAIDRILQILASSMLAVTTFSLGVMVTANNAATSHVSPRAAKLIVEDPITQNVLATFIGTFLFSLVGIIALATGAYGERGRGLLLIVTALIIVLVVVALVRWIDHLSTLGQVTKTADRVEAAAATAVRDRVRRPGLGGIAIAANEDDSPSSFVPVYPSETGYIQHIDMEALSELATPQGRIYVVALPGAFVHPEREIVRRRAEATAADDGNFDDQLREAFVIRSERSFDQDPRHGVSVLAEIASRALSSGVNDPGTAIDIVGRLVRILGYLHRGKAEPPRFANVFVPALKTADFFDDAFAPIARDGAGLVEVQIRLQKALFALASTGDPDLLESAADHARLAYARAQEALTFAADRERLSASVNALGWPVDVTHSRSD